MKKTLIATMIGLGFSSAYGATDLNLDTTDAPTTVRVNGVYIYPVPIQMHQGLPIDLSGIPPGDPGVGVDNVRPTTELPANSTAGAYRTICTFVKQAFDDSIVFPGQPGMSHSHTFWGNTLANSFSTYASLTGSGNSSCRGGTINRSSYWVSSVLDLKTNKIVLPFLISVYYKNGVFKPNGSTSPTPFEPTVDFKEFPPGLRIVAGDPTAFAPHPKEFSARWKCIGGPRNENDKYGPELPQCDVGAAYVQEIFFPQCWDGVNVDSPNHKSHMSYPVQVLNVGDPRGWSHNECPKTHPVVLPQIAYEISYLTIDPAQNVRLVSDTYASTIPPGYSSHGDWFGGWKSQYNKAWLDGCVKASKDCHAHLLGNGMEQF